MPDLVLQETEPGSQSLSPRLKLHYIAMLAREHGACKEADLICRIDLAAKDIEVVLVDNSLMCCSGRWPTFSVGRVCRSYALANSALNIDKVNALSDKLVLEASGLPFWHSEP